MPILTWDSKSEPTPIKSKLFIDSVIFPNGNGYDVNTNEGIPESQIILGDNLPVMSTLLEKYEEQIDLIYVDPPFFTNRRFSTRIGRGEDSRKPNNWQLAEGYPDAWDSLETYLNMLYERLTIMHQLLSPTGTLYLHLDWHANAYARVLLDEIFGSDHLINEIIWTYHGPSPIRTAFNRKHDTILMYSKSKKYTFNVDAIRQPYNPSTVKTFKSSSKAGFGKVPNLERGKVPEDWWYFPVVARLHNERTGYPTQKPEALIERIILASSNPGDIVADFFCGSGTTPVVANRLKRNFIASDSNWRAIHTTRSRLIANSSSPFILSTDQNSSLSYCAKQENIQVKLKDNNFTIHTSLFEELDYWEVDPNWNKKIFTSVYQAYRPPRKGEIPASLPVKQQFFKKPIGIRLVTIKGNIFQAEFTL